MAHRPKPDFSAFFQNDIFGECNFSICIDTTPCQPRIAREGICTFQESLTVFADYDLGNGAICSLIFDEGKESQEVITAEIYWLDWNEFRYRELVF